MPKARMQKFPRRLHQGSKKGQEQRVGVNCTIEASGPRPKKKRRGRAACTFSECPGKPMRAPEIAERLLSTGYETKSRNLKGLVSFTLAHGQEFRRVRRGLYALKK